MIAPGEAAEPGVTAKNRTEPAKRRQTSSQLGSVEPLWSGVTLQRFLRRPLRGLRTFWFALPQARLPSPGAIILSASFAGWLN